MKAKVKRCPIHNKAMDSTFIKSRGGYQYTCPVKECSYVLFVRASAEEVERESQKEW